MCCEEDWDEWTETNLVNNLRPHTFSGRGGQPRARGRHMMGVRQKLLIPRSSPDNRVAEPTRQAMGLHNCTTIALTSNSTPVHNCMQQDSRGRCRRRPNNIICFNTNQRPTFWPKAVATCSTKKKIFQLRKGSCVLESSGVPDGAPIHPLQLGSTMLRARHRARGGAISVVVRRRGL